MFSPRTALLLGSFLLLVLLLIARSSKTVVEEVTLEDFNAHKPQPRNPFEGVPLFDPKALQELPESMKEQWRKDRMVPSVFVIGTRKGGTTSLFHYIAEHPNFASPQRKELHFFDNFYSIGYNGYSNSYPERSSNPEALMTGEGSVGYLASCVAPMRLRQFADLFRIRPKFIVLFRDPIKRITSNFLMRQRLGKSNTNQVDLEDILKEQIAGLKTCLRRAGKDRLKEELCYCQPDGRTVPEMLLDSFYDHHLARWLQIFPREQFLFLSTRELEQHGAETLAKVSSFIGLPPFDFTSALAKKHNDRPPGQKDVTLSPSLIQELRGLYAQTEENLALMTGIHLEELREL